MRYALLALLALPAALHAELTFSNPSQELTVGVDSRNVTVDFPFTNATDKPVEIKKYDAGCSCITVQIANSKLIYAPGESGTVRAVFDLGNFSGTVEKAVGLWLDSNATLEPSQRLDVRIHIPVLVEMEPKTLKWDIGAAATSQSITIKMNDDKPIKVVSVSVSHENFNHELKTIEEGKHYELVITPKATDQPGLAIVRVETDCEVSRHKIAQAFAVIRRAVPGEAAATP
jgi:hypothetical protein